jgi:hypothetical protein
MRSLGSASNLNPACGNRTAHEGAGQLPALLLDRGSLPFGHQARKGGQALRLAKRPRMQGLILLLLVGVMLCCLGLLLSLPSTTSYAPSALAGVNVGHMDRGAGASTTVPDGSYPLAPAEELQDTNKLPVKASVLTMLILALVYFGACVGWLFMTNARRLAVMCFSLVDDRWWLAAYPEGPSFLGVFRL